MPTEYPACREADSVGSNPGVEAPWIEPVSRSASEPDSVSLHKVRTAKLPVGEVQKHAPVEQCVAVGTGDVFPRACANENPPIFHSDRGCQYTASSTRDLLHKHELLESMSAAGYCYDNAFAERPFASLKAELPGAEQPFPSKQAARLAIFDCIETFYNRRRRHTSLGSISPFDYLKINFTTHNKNLN